MKTQKSKSVGIYFLMGLLLLQGISAVYGGASLVLDPSGSTLQMPLSLLEQSPFNDYVIPGVILLLVLGIFPLSVFYGLWRRRKWSWLGALMVSLALITWIGVEITMVGYHSDHHCSWFMVSWDCYCCL